MKSILILQKKGLENNMGNELKDYKLYFKMAEDESNGWKELNDSCCEVREEIKQFIDENLNVLNGFSFDFELSKEQLKQYKKLIGESLLSKKRTRKLLMSKGFDRDTAQMYADTMKPRNMNKIKEMIEVAGNYEI